MERDDLQELWAALDHDRRLDERLLREALLGKVRRALAPGVVLRGVEMLLAVAALGALVPLLLRHAEEPLYLTVGGGLALFLVFALFVSGAQFAAAVRVDYGGAVAAIQRDLERLRMAEYRAFKWFLLGGIVFWLPAALLLFEAAFGVDALARVPVAWLVGNVLFGVLMFVVGQSLSVRHVERAEVRPWARRLLNALSGRGVAKAAGHLEELASFVREDRSA